MSVWLPGFFLLFSRFVLESDVFRFSARSMLQLPAEPVWPWCHLNTSQTVCLNEEQAWDWKTKHKNKNRDDISSQKDFQNSIFCVKVIRERWCLRAQQHTRTHTANTTNPLQLCKLHKNDISWTYLYFKKHWWTCFVAGSVFGRPTVSELDWPETARWLQHILSGGWVVIMLWLICAQRKKIKHSV